MISIVMPILNAENFLEECLDSTINQSYTDWELLAVNDHSIDNTENILKTYSNKDSRIQYLNNTGKGIIDALNFAYQKSSGSYITRMDSDDVMPNDKLSLMFQAVKENPNSLITGYVKYIAEGKLNDGYISYQNWLNYLVDSDSHYKEIYKECVIPSPCWLVSREIFERVGAFNSNVYPEDYDLSFRFYENKVPVLGIKEVLHIWRDHNTRASRNDENYSNNAFLDLKMHYFLKLNMNTEKTLVLWGAGKRSKLIAKILINNKVDFDWACNNKNKIGHNIYGVVLQDVRTCFNANENYQSIISIANQEDQKNIRNTLDQKQNIEAFWFC